MADEMIITYNLKQIGGRVVPSLLIQQTLPFAKVYTSGGYLKVRFPATPRQHSEIHSILQPPQAIREGCQRPESSRSSQEEEEIGGIKYGKVST